MLQTYRSLLLFSLLVTATLLLNGCASTTSSSASAPSSASQEAATSSGGSAGGPVGAGGHVGPILQSGGFPSSDVFRGLGFGGGAGAGAGASVASENGAHVAVKPPVKAIVTVYYGTNRKYIGDKYADTSSEKVDYGTVRVTIPVGHQRGQIESPNYQRFEFIDDPGKHFYVLKPVPLDEQTFFLRMNYDLDANHRQILLFVHGFNVSFNDDAKRTAQLAYDLKFQGIPVMFSWPSKGSVLSYPSDRDAGEASAAYLKTFISSLATESTVTNVTIIAHSMGTYALSEAILQIAADPAIRDKIKIKNIILASPDIDQELFVHGLAPAVEQVGNHCAIYVSDHDMALGFSSWVYHELRPRLGHGLFDSDLFELIDASGLEDGILDHSAYGDCGPALTDIAGFIQGEPPSTRANLVEVDRPCKHWRIAGP